MSIYTFIYTYISTYDMSIYIYIYIYIDMFNIYIYDFMCVMTKQPNEHRFTHPKWEWGAGQLCSLDTSHRFFTQGAKSSGIEAHLSSASFLPSSLKEANKMRVLAQVHLAMCTNVAQTIVKPSLKSP